ncbi:MAG: helix-hairpin-helix domain-containing protein [Saprospiraceae bacterium]
MTTAAKIKKNITRKKFKNNYGRIHDHVLSVSEETVEITVENLGKWQKLFAKSLNASTPLVEKGIDLTFTVAETLVEQYKTGGIRMISLLGLGSSVLKKKKNRSLNGVKKTAELSAITASKEKVLLRSDVKKVTAKVGRKSLTKKSSITKPKTIAKNTLTRLTDINGIGPKIERLLIESGIKSISDLAGAKIITIEKVLDAAGPRFQIHDPKTWINQAKKNLKA